MNMRQNTSQRMNLTIASLTTTLLLAMASAPLGLQAQTFSSGSTGAYGPMNITTNTTLDLPSDGIFHCTTITVAAGATLNFKPNSLNTPVYLLATGAISVVG